MAIESAANCWRLIEELAELAVHVSGPVIPVMS